MLFFWTFQRYRREEPVEEEVKLSDLEDPNYTPYVPVRERKLDKLSKLGARIIQTKKAANDSSDSEKDEDKDEEEDPQALARKENISLLDQHTELKRLAEGKSYVLTSGFNCIM